jgi:glycosyltransferase involved in cell wall biosynthesis
MNISLIITTYNWPEALRVTLGSALAQSKRPEEIIIADDGSGPETAQVVREVLQPSGLRWCHVWHQDLGVRQSRIKNLAVRHSAAPYLIFADQDVVLHPEFIADHLLMAREGSFLQGKRALVPEDYTGKILKDGVFDPPGPWIRGLGNRKNTFRFPRLGRLFSFPKQFDRNLRGCNLSMFKRDFHRVDGFDETFDQSWGREDSDICYRLFHCGLRVRNLWFMALQYHLYHKVTTDWERERLDGEIERGLREGRIKSLKGLSRISSEGEILAASSGFRRKDSPSLAPERADEPGV